jgi:hypothetical protein
MLAQAWRAGLLDLGMRQNLGSIARYELREALGSAAPAVRVVSFKTSSHLAVSPAMAMLARSGVLPLSEEASVGGMEGGRGICDDMKRVQVGIQSGNTDMIVMIG